MTSDSHAVRMDSTGQNTFAGKRPTFHSFETSAAIIKRGGWKIRNPDIRELSDKATAQAFIKTLPRGDRRRNWEESRFRLLCIKVENRSQILEQTAIVSTAAESGWINSEFATNIIKGNAGSAVLMEKGNISSSIRLSFSLLCAFQTEILRAGLNFQTPNDKLPFITLSISELHRPGRQRGSDWVCLLFTGPGVDLEWLLSEHPFPSDYASLFPDFMFLPVSILRQEVERVGAGLMKLKEDVLDKHGEVLSSDPADLGDTKKTLFELDRKYLELQERWKFGQVLAANLIKCFGEIVRLQTKEIDKLKYSKTLLQQVETQIALSNMAQQELDAIPSRLNQQHRMIDSKLTIMIAEDTRRDSSSMKTIAVLTLIFLPATALASIFGMSMFDWKAQEGKDIVSHRFWIYVIVAVLLTLVVLTVWFLWYARTQRSYEKIWRKDDVESANTYSSKPED
ncbi:hypothetical protein PV08_02722 [Exophiala spinifera]|uniref:Uncharacterized protein n=1 Tax=Exophiala spinifera TaxID=91928 RepID=A0A0D2C4B2_9EURO|nr:uncharacterized protein PV08_02722 [Exophiala spinifera]KIW18434.1 hypothetical protein PV08_02722 [Exophiala spinifera]